MPFSKLYHVKKLACMQVFTTRTLIQIHELKVLGIVYIGIVVLMHSHMFLPASIVLYPKVRLVFEKWACYVSE